MHQVGYERMNTWGIQTHASKKNAWIPLKSTDTCIGAKVCISFALATSTDPDIWQATSSPPVRVLDARALDVNTRHCTHPGVIPQNQLAWLNTRSSCFHLAKALEYLTYRKRLLTSAYHCAIRGTSHVKGVQMNQRYGWWAVQQEIELLRGEGQGSVREEGKPRCVFTVHDQKKTEYRSS